MDLHWTVQRAFCLLTPVALAAVFITCSGDSPQANPTVPSRQTAMPAQDAPYSPASAEPIEAVFSWVPSLPGGAPLRPLFIHLPKDRKPIESLARALETAVPISEDEHLKANDRGRYLLILNSDWTNTAIRQVVRCEPWSDADAEASTAGRCRGNWVHEDDTWWIEEVGMVKSSEISRWWGEMNGFMAPIGGVGIPKTMKPGESYEITLVDWDDVIDGDSVNLSLETSAGEEIGLGEFPVSDTVQGQVAVPGQTPDAPYWVRVSGKGFSELANFVYVGDMEYMRRQDTSVKYGWMRSPDTLVVNAGTCKMNPEVSFLEETDVAVRIMMRTDFYPFRQSFQECLTAKIVQLQEPLGDRVVMDMHTGRVVSVTPVAGASPASSQQDQPESPPTEVVPQAIREAVSDAELQDLQAVAEQYGMTLQEAFDRYAWNDNFSRAVQRIRSAAPDTFGGAEIVDATNAWIAFTGTPPEAALDIIDALTRKHSTVSVEVRTGQKITEAELEEAIPAVHYAVYRSPGVLNASTSFDNETGEIVSVVVLENTAPDSVLDDLRAIAEQRLVEVMRPDILDSVSVSVVRSRSPVLGGTD